MHLSNLSNHSNLFHSAAGYDGVLPEPGMYATGLLFVDRATANQAEATFASFAEKYGLRVGIEKVHLDMCVYISRWLCWYVDYGQQIQTAGTRIVNLLKSFIINKLYVFSLFMSNEKIWLNTMSNVDCYSCNRWLQPVLFQWTALLLVRWPGLRNHLYGRCVSFECYLGSIWHMLREMHKLFV